MTSTAYIIQQSTITEVAIINTLKLLGEGATVPFIARYRKELTHGLDEVEIMKIRDLNKKFNFRSFS